MSTRYAQRVPKRRRLVQHLRVLDEDAIADVEGDASLLLRLAKVGDDEPPNVVSLCRALTGYPPFLTRTGPEAALVRVGDVYRVTVRRGLLPARARWLVGHELAEWHYLRVRYLEADIEARCDALGACLVAPRASVLRAMRARDGVRSLARALNVTQSCALLRLGEVVRRPVVAHRPRGLTTRGAAFAWPEALARGQPVRVRGARLVQLVDERRWGMLAA